MQLCPCGFGEVYQQCCGRLHRGETDPVSAEVLMRSRYSAFALGNADYLLVTWHSTTRPARLMLPAGRRWTGLRILGRTGGGLFDHSGTVDFQADYSNADRDGERGGSQRENSQFVREDGQWRYLSAVTGGAGSDRAGAYR